MFVGFCWDVDGISHSIPSTAKDHCFLDMVDPRRNKNCVMAALWSEEIQMELIQ